MRRIILMTAFVVGLIAPASAQKAEIEAVNAKWITQSKTSLACLSAECAGLTRSAANNICSAISTEFQFRYNNRSGLGITDGGRTAIGSRGYRG